MTSSRNHKTGPALPEILGDFTLGDPWIGEEERNACSTPHVSTREEKRKPIAKLQVGLWCLVCPLFSTFGSRNGRWSCCLQPIVSAHSGLLSGNAFNTLITSG